MENNNGTTKCEEEKPIISIIDGIKEGTIAPKTIPKGSRQGCVEVLMGEGCTVAAIAKILSRSEKTITRDLQEIRQKNALVPSMNLAKEVIGEMFKHAHTHHSYLMRLARIKGASVMEKTQAEFGAWKVIKEFIERMQSLGYLPSRPQEILGKVFHHYDLEEERSCEEIKSQIIEVESIANESGGVSPETREEIKGLKLLVDKAEVVERTVALEKKLQEETKRRNEDEKEC